MALVKKIRFVPLLALPFLIWLLPSASEGIQQELVPEKVNLALRRTADRLLRESGDSSSRIPAVEQHGSRTWRVRLEQAFDYDQLPALLQSSLEQNGISQAYAVTLRRCDDASIELGYNQLDYLEEKVAACSGRELPEGCRYIEITFEEKQGKTPLWMSRTGLLLLLLGGFAGFWISRRKQNTPTETLSDAAETDWLQFGNSKLDVAGQILVCAGVRESLTFRETKLLQLFVASSDRLLERDFILQNVWADEGILVGRSVDVFISRLRKKLKADSSIGIVAVHGVGYRLETGKTSG